MVEYIIEKNGQVAYNAEVEEKVNTSENSIGNGSGFTNSADDRDAYFADAGKFIIEKEKGSIGMLQRMFKSDLTVRHGLWISWRKRGSRSGGGTSHGVY